LPFFVVQQQSFFGCQSSSLSQQPTTIIVVLSFVIIFGQISHCKEEEKNHLQSEKNVSPPRNHIFNRLKASS
jgi:hypothetical protein